MFGSVCNFKYPKNAKSFVRQDANVGQEGMQRFNSSLKCSVGFNSGLYAKRLSSPSLNSSSQIFMYLSVHRKTATLVLKGLPLNFCTNVGSTKMSVGPAELKGRFTEQRGQAHTLINSPTLLSTKLYSSLSNMHSSRWHLPGKCRTQIYPDYQAVNNNSSCLGVGVVLL